MSVIASVAKQSRRMRWIASSLTLLAMTGCVTPPVATESPVSQAGVAYNAHVIESILKLVAPALGWR